MWDKWETPKTIRKTVRKVGISEDRLNFTDMQQEKFFQAENLMDIEKSAHSPVPSSSWPAPSSSTLSPASPKHLRKGSAMYWEAKLEVAQQLIYDCNEKSLRLEEIPGLLTVQKVKPKQLTKSSTQVHGSMEAKDVINLVKSIKEQKEQKVKSKEIQTEKKEKGKEDFYRCKNKCVCKEDRCLATGLKECPSCHSILRSVYSKARCKVDGKKPKMLLPITTTKKRTSRKLFESFDESESETDVSEESDGDVDVSDDSDGFMETSDDEDKSGESQNEAAVSQLKKVWGSLDSLTTEEEILGKWYAVVYAGKKSMSLFVAKILRRFLIDANSPVESILMRYLKPIAGSETRLQARSEHLPPTDAHVKLEDIIAGPLEVIPVGRSSMLYEVPEYNELKNFFEVVNKSDRKQLKELTEKHRGHKI